MNRAPRPRAKRSLRKPSVDSEPDTGVSCVRLVSEHDMTYVCAVYDMIDIVGPKPKPSVAPAVTPPALSVPVPPLTARPLSAASAEWKAAATSA